MRLLDHHISVTHIHVWNFVNWEFSKRVYYEEPNPLYKSIGYAETINI